MKKILFGVLLITGLAYGYDGYTDTKEFKIDAEIIEPISVNAPTIDFGTIYNGYAEEVDELIIINGEKGEWFNFELTSDEHGLIKPGDEVNSDGLQMTFKKFSKSKKLDRSGTFEMPINIKVLADENYGKRNFTKTLTVKVSYKNIPVATVE